MNNSLIKSITSSLQFMSPSEKKLATYILAHKKEILSMPMKELANKSGVSEATITRFARSMGTKGFADFKVALSASLAPQSKTDVTLLESIRQDDKPIDIYHKIASFSIQSIQNTDQLIDEKALNSAVDIIDDARNNHHSIFLSGSGVSSQIAEMFRVKMMRLNIPVYYYEDAHLHMESFLSIKKHDVLVAFTTLGRSVETRQCMEIAHNRKAKVIVLTQYGNKDLEKYADVILNNANIENDHRLISSTAVITQLTIIDALFFSLAMKNYDELCKDVRNTRKEFVRLKLSTKEEK